MIMTKNEIESLRNFLYNKFLGIFKDPVVASIYTTANIYLIKKAGKNVLN